MIVECWSRSSYNYTQEDLTLTDYRFWTHGSSLGQHRTKARFLSQIWRYGLLSWQHWYFVGGQYRLCAHCWRLSRKNACERPHLSSIMIKRRMATLKSALIFIGLNVLVVFLVVKFYSLASALRATRAPFITSRKLLTNHSTEQAKR